jgi:hypothetical protein
MPLRCLAPCRQTLFPMHGPSWPHEVIALGLRCGMVLEKEGYRPENSRRCAAGWDSESATRWRGVAWVKRAALTLYFVAK